MLHRIKNTNQRSWMLQFLSANAMKSNKLNVSKYKATENPARKKTQVTSTTTTNTTQHSKQYNTVRPGSLDYFYEYDKHKSILNNQKIKNTYEDNDFIHVITFDVDISNEENVTNIREYKCTVKIIKPLKGKTASSNKIFIQIQNKNTLPQNINSKTIESVVKTKYIVSKRESNKSSLTIPNELKLVEFLTLCKDISYHNGESEKDVFKKISKQLEKMTTHTMNEKGILKKIGK